MLYNPGEYSPHRVWCTWDDSHVSLTRHQLEMVIRLANAEESFTTRGGPRYMPIAWDELEKPVLCVDCIQSSSTGAWMFVTELFEQLPEDLRKLVIHS